jgi:hypothetical protein
MKTLTFAFDAQLNDQEDYIPAGTQVKVYNTWRQHEGFTPVLVEAALTYKGKPITVNQVEYFTNQTFVENRS